MEEKPPVLGFSSSIARQWSSVRRMLRSLNITLSSHLATLTSSPFDNVNFQYRRRIANVVGDTRLINRLYIWAPAAAWSDKQLLETATCQQHFPWPEGQGFEEDATNGLLLFLFSSENWLRLQLCWSIYIYFNRFLLLSHTSRHIRIVAFAAVFAVADTAQVRWRSQNFTPLVPFILSNMWSYELRTAEIRAFPRKSHFIIIPTHPLSSP
jgi:hypothetical protein